MLHLQAETVQVQEEQAPAREVRVRDGPAVRLREVREKILTEKNTDDARPTETSRLITDAVYCLLFIFVS